MASGLILIAGVGNILMRDDGFGPAVAMQLAERDFGQRVRVEDFGTRSMDLAFALADAWAAVLIDAAPRGGRPGEVYLLDLTVESDTAEPAPWSVGHGVNLNGMLQWLARIGHSNQLWLVGCEPESIEALDGEIGLTPSVAEAVPRAALAVEYLVERLIQNQGDA